MSIFGKLLHKVLLPAAKKVVQKELDKKTGGIVRIDDIVGLGKKIL